MDNLTNTIKQTLYQSGVSGIECHIYLGISNTREVIQGDNIAQILSAAVENLIPFQDQDILIIASKIISKAEGNIVDLTKITPTEGAINLSKESNKSSEVCQVILDESTSHFVENGVIIARHKRGYQLTSAGVDKLDDNFVATIPDDSDKTAKNIMKYIKEHTGKDVAVIVTDSEGRADRGGAGSIALGIAGLNPLRVQNYANSDGTIKETEETLSDLFAGGASVLMGQRGKGVPAVLVRGFNFVLDINANMQSIIH